MIVNYIDRRRIKRLLRKGLCVVINCKYHEDITYGWNFFPTKYGSFSMVPTMYVNPSIKNLVHAISIRKCSIIKIIGFEPDGIKIIDEPPYRKYDWVSVLVHFKDKNDMTKFKLLTE